MEDSPWIALLARAAASRLLDTEEGCPPTIPYLIRERMVIDELARRDAVERHSLFALLEGSAGQLYSKIPGVAIETSLFNAARGEAHKQQLMAEIHRQPWNRKQIASRLSDVQTKLEDSKRSIGDTGLTPGGLVKMVQEYEELKKKRAKRPK